MRGPKQSMGQMERPSARPASAQPVGTPRDDSELPHILLGVTNDQTCLILAGRLRALREAGFRVTLVSSPGPQLKQIATRENVQCVELRMERGISPFRDCISLWKLFRLLCRLKPDVTEFSTPKAGLLGTLAARMAGIRRRVYLLRGLRMETTTGLKGHLLLLAEKLAASSAHSVLCNSESLRNECLRLAVAHEPKLLMLRNGSSNGVDGQRFSPGPSDLRWKLGIPERVVVIGFVGRLTCDKGIPELIEGFDAALDEAPDTYLLLVGWFDESDDPLSEELQERITNHPRIVCTGFVQDTAPYYKTMDLLILPSRREGFPNAALEAASSGIPVIATFATGARDAVVPGLTGILIPKRSPAAICAASLELIRDKKRRLRMGQEARRWALQYFSDSDVLEATTDFYRSLVDADATTECVTEPVVSMR